jgi:hypothetical protein
MINLVLILLKNNKMMMSNNKTDCKITLLIIKVSIVRNRRKINLDIGFNLCKKELPET